MRLVRLAAFLSLAACGASAFFDPLSALTQMAGPSGPSAPDAPVIKFLIEVIKSIDWPPSSMGCVECQEHMMDEDLELNSTDTIETMMNRTWDKCHELHDEDFFADLEPECLQWYYNNYDILIQFYQVLFDELAWSVFDPAAVCVFFDNCDCKDVYESEDCPGGSLDEKRKRKMETIMEGQLPLFDWIFT